jgi:hypothetical protein
MKTNPPQIEQNIELETQLDHIAQKRYYNVLRNDNPFCELQFHYFVH